VKVLVASGTVELVVNVVVANDVVAMEVV